MCPGNSSVHLKSISGSMGIMSIWSAPSFLLTWKIIGYSKPKGFVQTKLWMFNCSAIKQSVFMAMIFTTNMTFATNWILQSGICTSIVNMYTMRLQLQEDTIIYMSHEIVSTVLTVTNAVFREFQEVLELMAAVVYFKWRATKAFKQFNTHTESYTTYNCTFFKLVIMPLFHN